MKHLIILVGAPGTGKSTFATETLLKKYGNSCHIVSRDAIRFSLVSEDEKYFSKEQEVYNTYIEEIKKSLNSNEYTIADATHLNTQSRRKLFRSLGKEALEDIEITAYVILNDLDTVLNQNAKREGRAFVHPDIVKNMYTSLQIPTTSEGFDNVIIFKNGEFIRECKNLRRNENE